MAVAGLTHFGTTSMETFSGAEVQLDDPMPSMFNIKDIAVGLANTCRFNGHVKRYYSVAEHSVIVSQILTAQGKPGLALAGLLHDAAEAYLGDVISPIKGLLRPTDYDYDPGRPLYDDLTESIEVVIGKAFDIDPALFSYPAVKAADTLALRMEALALCHSRGSRWHWSEETLVTPFPEGIKINCWDPLVAQFNFKLAYERLTPNG